MQRGAKLALALFSVIFLANLARHKFDRGLKSPGKVRPRAENSTKSKRCQLSCARLINIPCLPVDWAVLQDAIDPSPDNRFSPGPNHNQPVPLRLTSRGQFRLTCPLHPINTSCLSVVSVPQLQIHLSSMCLCPPSIRSLRQLVQSGPDTSPALTLLISNFPGLRFSLPRVSLPPATISSLFYCKSLSRVGPHNGWDRLPVR